VLGRTGRHEARLQRRARPLQETQPRQVITVADVTTEGGCVSRVGGSGSEGDTGSAGGEAVVEETQVLQEGEAVVKERQVLQETQSEPQRLANCNVKRQIFTIDNVNFAAP
jgi:hypothetical protein